MGWKKLYDNLIAFLDVLPDDVDPIRLLQRIQEWLRVSVTHFGSDIRAVYGLDELVSMDISRYPTSESEFSAPEELRQLRRGPSRSKDGLAMRIRDLFWNGTTVCSRVMCPQCGAVESKILEDRISREIILACDNCGYAEKADGEPLPEDRPRRADPIDKERFATIAAEPTRLTRPYRNP